MSNWFLNILSDLGNMIGLGDDVDKLWSKLGGSKNATIRSKNLDKSPMEYASDLANAILERVNKSDFKKKYSNKLAQVTSLMNDIATRFPSLTFANKFAAAARRANQIAQDLSRYDQQFTDKINKANAEANKASTFTKRTDLNDEAGTIEGNINKELDDADKLSKEIDKIII